MTALMGNVSSFIGSAVGWMGEFLEEVTSDESGILVTFVVAVPLVGLGIGLFKRLVHVRG